VRRALISPSFRENWFPAGLRNSPSPPPSPLRQAVPSTCSPFRFSLSLLRVGSPFRPIRIWRARARAFWRRLRSLRGTPTRRCVIATEPDGRSDRKGRYSATPSQSRKCEEMRGAIARFSAISRQRYRCALLETSRL